MGMGKAYTGNMMGSKGNVSASNGPTGPKGKSAKGGTMGTSKGSAKPPSQGGDVAGLTAGRARTNRGKNTTGSGSQGFRG